MRKDNTKRVSGKDRRQTPRAKVELKIKCILDMGPGEDEKAQKESPAETSDLSSGGLSFKTKEIIVKDPAKSNLEFELELPGYSKKIRSLCEVVWYDMLEEETEPLYAFGVKFLGLKPEERESVKRYVEDIIKREASENINERRGEDK